MTDSTSETIVSIILHAVKRFRTYSFIKAAGREPMSYEVFGNMFSYVNKFLRCAGLGAEARIGVKLPAGPEQASCLLCVMGSATCIPITEHIPEPELGRILTPLNLDAVILTSASSDSEKVFWRALGIRIFTLHDPTHAAAGVFSLSGVQLSDCVKTCWPTAEDVGLILLTSGTTGSPKHVPHSQAGLAHTARASSLFFRHTHEDAGLAIMPLEHGQGLFVGLLPVLVSGSSVICSTSLDPGVFFELFDTFNPTWFTAIPTFYQALLVHARRHRIIPSIHNLRYIRTGSAPMEAEVMRDVEALFGLPLLMGYGSAESCHIANNPISPGQNKPGTVGIPYGNDIAVINEYGQNLPNGEVGEVVVRGPQVTRGYLDNDKANAALFVNGWLRTGDLGKLDDDGYLSLVGRLKDQINRGGESISPGEVEETIRSHPAVLQAVVFAFAHPALGEEIAAAIVPREEGLNADMIANYLISALAANKIPREYLLLKELPLTRIGKVNKIALASLLEEARLLQQDTQRSIEEAPPSGELEELVANTFASVLQQPTPGRNANFFQLGGDSLSGQRAVIALEQQLALDLSPTLLFAYPTVRNLAEQLDKLLDQALAEAEQVTS